MANGQSISEIICSKGWTSMGAVRHIGNINETSLRAFSTTTSQTLGQLNEYYPKVGMQFTATRGPTNFAAQMIKKYTWTGVDQQDDNSYREDEFEAPPLSFVTVVFEQVNQESRKSGRGLVPTTDPATHLPTQLFPPDFLDKFTHTTYYEYGNYLVSQPIILPEKPAIAVNFVIELYIANGQVYMLQRSFWNGSYVGTYCCV